MMFGTIFRNQANVQAQVLAAQNHLDRARLERIEQHFEAALNLYNNARVAFENANQATPILSQLNRAFSRARTPEEEALRRHIADVYYERAEVLETLGGRFDEAQESRRDALAWDSNEIESASILHAVPLPVLGALLVGVGALAAPWIWAWWTRSTASTSMLLQPQSLAPMPLPPQSLAPMPLQQLPVVPAQAKSKMVDYLFKKALSTLESLEASNKPSLFLIYAHDNLTYGQAEADTSKYLINKLSQVRANLYSDQTPMGKPYLSSPEDLKEDDKLEDILISQLRLLPDPLRDDVKPVDKVVVCCSELLGRYLRWPHYEEFYQQIQEAYFKDREAYRKNGAHAGTPAIRQVVRQFSQEQAYKADFHHVLTEMAFLQIRAEQLRDQYGIIPVSLTPNSYEQCLAPFIPATRVRIEDILRFDEQAKAGRQVYPNQGRHLVLFKLIERLIVGNDEAQTFLDKFWEGYNECISRLKNDSMLDAVEFAELVDGIFGKVEAELRRKLVNIVQEEQKQLPPTISLADLRSALYHHYLSNPTTNLSIQRISGQIASLDDSYINLAIVESHAQREKEWEALKKQAAAFERLPSEEYIPAANPNKQIALEALFNPQTLRDGSTGAPKRILIQGRAGIGKTTLCKKLVYDYQYNTAWQDRFESMIWVPLRQLKTLQIYNLEKLLCEYYFADVGGSRKAQALAQRVLDHQDKTLFILDGLDEVVSELDPSHPLSRFLTELLNKEQVVITSRPAMVDVSKLKKLDLELETVGFSPDDVQAYIEKFAPESNKTAIQQFIHRTPLIQSLVYIPIQLDALCFSWDKLPKDQAVITMTMLYEAMVDRLWRKDGVRLKKKDNGEVLDPSVIGTLLPSDIEALMSAELNYLGYIAFEGLKANEKIEFSVQELNQYRVAFNKKPLIAGKLPLQITTDLKKTSYLHTIDTQRPESDRRYHFLHLTLQEFFAAKFLVHHLQAYSEVEGMSGLVLSQEQLQAFITEHKYNPRYEIVWWMVAGLLSDAALERFFTSLEEVPRDLIGGRHQQVMMGCLNEARAQLNKTAVDRLETELMQWLRFEIKLSEHGLSELGRRMTFPEHLLLRGLEQTVGEKEGIIETLGERLTLSEVAILALIEALRDDNRSIRDAAAIALVTQRTLPEAAISALNNALKDDSEQIRSTAAWIIGAQKAQPEAAILTLIHALRNEDREARSAAAQALGKYRTLPEAAISALINAIRDEKRQAIKAVEVYALGEQRMLPKAAIYALIDVIQDKKNQAAKAVAAQALGKQKMLPEAAISALINALQNEDPKVKFEAAQAFLGKHKMLSKAAIFALTYALQDENPAVRSAVIRVLREQDTLPEASISALTNAILGENPQARSAVTQALGKQKMLPEAAISALINALKDENREVRFMAAQRLGEQETLPEASISALINTIHDEDQAIRAMVFIALGEQKMLPEAAISALVNAIQDEKIPAVKAYAAQALGKQKMLPEAAISALISALHDENQTVKTAAAQALGKLETLPTLPEAAISALTNLLQDENLEVRCAVALALGKQKMLPETAIFALTNVLQDAHPEVRSIVALALGKQETLPEAAISALTNALPDENHRVRFMVGWALGEQETLPEAAISALTNALPDKNPEARFAVAQALGKQETLPEAAISALTNLLQDENLQVRSAVAQALGKQETLPETAISALTNLLQDENLQIRFAVAQALGKQETLPETAISALINTLQDENYQVRFMAGWALGEQETLPEAAISALINVLKNKKPEVRSAVAQALGEQETLPEAAISALINALQDENYDVRFMVGWALGEQEMLPEAAIYALTNTLKNKKLEVKSEVAWVLSKQETLPEVTISALTDALQDENYDVRSMAALALGKQETLPEAAISALTNALKDENHKVRFMVAQALGKQETLPEAAISALTNALKNKKPEVRSEVAWVLSKQETLPEATISALTNALQDENYDVRSVAAQALGKQETLPEAAISALTNALQDENKKVKSVVAWALGRQEMLPEAAISALINALQDENQAIKAVAVLALGKQETLPEAAISALIKALQDGSRPVRAVAAQVLGEQKTLLEAAISALTNALQDEEPDVRFEAAQALGEQKTLQADTISALIFTMQDENKKVSSAAARALGGQLDQLYSSLPRLEFKQIQTLYIRVFFPRSCKYIAPLYIQDNQLHFYTAKGPGQPIELTSEQIETLIKALREVRSEAGIPPLPEDNNLPTIANQSQKKNNFLASPPVNSENIQTLSRHDLSASGLRFSIGQRPIGPAHYVPRAQSDQLLALLKAKPTALIEVIGPPGMGKTALLQRLIDPRSDLFASYDLIAWIDCSSVSRAYADIQAISHALDYGNPSPEEALQQVVSYLRQHPRSLLILDGLTPSNVDLVLTWLNPSFWSGQLIYTTTETLTGKLSQSLGQPVESIPLSFFTPDQAKHLVQQYLPKESLKACNFSQVIRMTGGYPGIIQALCQHYQASIVGFRNFADFLAQPEKHQEVRDTLLSEIAQASLGPLETEAVTNQITARAWNLIKQAAWLGDHRIPFAFFVNAHQQVDQDAIQTLYHKQLAILDIDRSTQSLKLNPAFLSVVQKRYPSEQRALLEKNIQRLSEVFSYLTDNESAKGHHSQPEDLKLYADLVHTLLFETCATVSFSDNPSLRSQVLKLGSSLARLYYLYHGELQQAYDCLQRAQHFFKQGLSEEQIADFEDQIEQFEQAPADFTSPSITQEESKLLKLYAQEYLYQGATIASQLFSRGQVAVEVIQNFEKSYAIQINLGQHADPEAIAYTLRNLTRALRKQGLLVDALKKHEALTLWIDQHPMVFNERVRAELLVDQGIIQKELEDAKPEGQRNYQAAIDLLYETHRIYLKHETANQGQALGMLSIYLGETHLAAGDFEKGITHIYRILHYDGKNQERQARAYFNLARSFHEVEYVALAKLFLDKALPLQMKTYKSKTETLSLKIEQKLLQRHQQTASDKINTQTDAWETQADLTAYCEEQLLSGSEPPNILYGNQIRAAEDTAYNWLWQHHSKANLEAQQAALVSKLTALEAQEKAHAEKHALQLKQDKVWYRTFAQRINLNASENRTARIFAHQFKEALLDLIIQQLRLAYGEKVPMDKIAVAEWLIQAVSGVATTGVTGTVDLAALVQGLTKTLSEWHYSHEQAGAQRIADSLEEPEQQPKSLQVGIRIQQQIEEMAYYAARCWQPVLSRQDWSNPEDIQTLAKYGALRVMEYLKTGRADTLSSQERVVLALMTGKANTRLTQRKAGEPGQSLKGYWSVQGFFAEPGIKVEVEKEEQAVYLPSWQAHPNVYGYRFGSPVEARTRPYQGPFENEAEAQQRAEAARHQHSPCTVM